MNILKCKCTAMWSGYAPTVIRIGLGIILAVHGWQKFSQMGLVGVTGFFDSLGIPFAMFFAGVVMFVELVGGIALIVGAFTHYVAKFAAIDMIVALFLVHWEKGFYIQNGGYEFTLILFASAVSLILSGAGKLSVDEWLSKRS